jgi:hypothetical protein
MSYNVTTCEAAAQAFFDAAVIRGTYRSQETGLVSALLPIHRPGVRRG